MYIVQDIRIFSSKFTPKKFTLLSFIQYHKMNTENIETYAMKIDENIHFKFYKFLAIMCGLWPYQSKFSKIITLIIYIMLIISLIVALIAGIQDDQHMTYNVLSQNIAATMFLSAALSQTLLICKNKSKIKDLCDQYVMGWKEVASKKESEILSSYAIKGLIRAPWLAVYTGPALVILFFTTVGLQFFTDVDKTEDTEFPYYYKNMIIDERFRLQQICLHCFIVVLFACMHFYTVCATFTICTCHVCGIYTIARYRLQNSTKSMSNSYGYDTIGRELEYEDEIYLNLIGVVRKHNEAINLIRLIDQVYSQANLIMQLLAFVTVGFLLSNVFIIKTESIKVVPPCMILGTYIMCGYFVNGSGQLIIEISDRMSLDIYSIEWYILSTKAKKLLLFIMQRSYKPETLTAWSMWSMSMENFTWFLQGSWSLATLSLTCGKK